MASTRKPKIISGKELSEEIRAELKVDVEAIARAGAAGACGGPGGGGSGEPGVCRKAPDLRGLRMALLQACRQLHREAAARADRARTGSVSTASVQMPPEHIDEESHQCD